MLVTSFQSIFYLRIQGTVLAVAEEFATVMEYTI